MHSHLVQLRSCAKDMTITIYHNKLPDRKWGWSVDGVMAGRDGPENLRILKSVCWDWTIGRKVWFSDIESWILTVERCSCDFRISTDRDLKHHKMRCAWGRSLHNMVSIDFWELYHSPRVAMDRSQKLINLFVSETTGSACELYLYTYCITVVIDLITVCNIYIYIYIYIRGSLNKFPDFYW